MSKPSDFTLNRWLISPKKNIQNNKLLKPSAKHERLPSFKAKKRTKAHLSSDGTFNASNFLVQGWSGDSLKSKNTEKLERIIGILTDDVFNQITKIENLNSIFKNAIFEDFIAYAESLNKKNVKIDSATKFWQEVFNKDSEQRENIDGFLHVYAYRVALIYFYKIRFISELSRKLDRDIELRNIFYPNAFLLNIFGRGGANGLPAAAIESNLYSWYRPTSTIKNSLLNLVNLCFELTVAEISKTVAESEALLMKNCNQFSHTISHKNTGLFINALLINFPIWEDLIGHKLFSSTEVASNLEVISTKFCGDYLSDLALSHWLAQENNKDFKWDQILCPDFKSREFNNNCYFKLCNELQFLTFLTDISHFQSEDLIDFICKVYKGHTSNKKSSHEYNQEDFLLNDQRLKKSTYDRIVLNLTDLPISNPHHYLCNKIKEEFEDLKDVGLLYVMSNQKLFIPSQKNRVDKILELYSIEAIVTMEEIKGKGEIGNYLYILSKKRDSLIFDKLKNEYHKEYVFHYTLSANLETYYQFSQVTDLLQNFFVSQNDQAPPVYHDELENGFKLTFHQDCIVDARLLNSSVENKNEITHPSFFKNLINTCLPFDNFFDITLVDSKDSLDSDTNLNLIESGNTYINQFSTICMVNLTEEQPRVKFLKPKNLEHFVFEFGNNNIFYFGLKPLRSGLNLNLFQEYFDTPIGEQITRLIFLGAHKNVKAKLAKFLIPKFFDDNKNLPEHLKPAMAILNFSEEKILEQHPIELKKRYMNSEKFFEELVELYPFATISDLSHFCVVLKNTLSYFEQGNFLNINFNNPIIRDSLTQLTLTPLFDSTNKDIHLEFMPQVRIDELSTNLSHTEIKTLKTKDLTHHLIEIKNEEGTVFKIYSDYYMICFLNYLLSSCHGISLKNILENLKIPKVADLKDLIENYLSFKEVSEYIYRRSKQLIGSSISKYINNSN